ncbi:MAG: hypothetical protein M1812_006673 [Candelaria pacifica]|nr:MAG: hypothetical protein M1812_006673 [Candelaria pacifica]
MTLKDLLKKKDKIKEDETHPAAAAPEAPPEFTFMRTTTTTQEIISPPTYAGDNLPTVNEASNSARRSRFRRNSNASTSSNSHTPQTEKGERRLSQRLHLRSRTASSASVNLPNDLPSINDGVAEESDEQQAKWEKRATLLAKNNPSSRPGTPGAQDGSEVKRGRSRSVSLSNEKGDVRYSLWLRLVILWVQRKIGRLICSHAGEYSRSNQIA